MDNIVLDGRKIFANVPRFNREQSVQKSAAAEESLKQGNKVSGVNNVPNQSYRVKGGSSYSDVLQNINVASGSKAAEIGFKILSFYPNIEDVIQYKKSLYRKVKDNRGRRGFFLKNGGRNLFN